MQNRVTGTRQLVQRLQNLGQQGQRMADAIVNSVADEMVLEAKQNAPADLGQTRQQIGKESLGGGQVSVFSNATHSGYVEFGTGPQVSIPVAFNELAQRVRQRKGGNFEEFVLSLTGWVRRKGMPENAAYPIARAILRRGLKPRPFFYPAYVTARRKLPQRLSTGLQRLTRNA